MKIAVFMLNHDGCNTPRLAYNISPNFIWNYVHKMLLVTFASEMALLKWDNSRMCWLQGTTMAFFPFTSDELPKGCNTLGQHKFNFAMYLRERCTVILI